MFSLIFCNAIKQFNDDARDFGTKSKQSDFFCNLMSETFSKLYKTFNFYLFLHKKKNVALPGIEKFRQIRDPEYKINQDCLNGNK